MSHTQSTTETAQIFSSTGSLGISERQDNRLYQNGPFFGAPDELDSAYLGLIDEGHKRADHISRVVLRAIISDEAMHDVLEGDTTHLRSDLAVAVPLQEFGKRGWLTYFAQNFGERGAQVDVGQIMSVTTEYRTPDLLPADRVITSIQAGVRMHTRIADGLEPQLESLWGKTFGWSVPEVEALAARLDAEQLQNPADRTVWFAATEQDGVLTSASMAERLSLPGADGPIDLVESTEWRAAQGTNGQIGSALSVLHTSILRDLRTSTGESPLIFAECNYQSRADRVGNSVGMTIPGRQYAPQVLASHVHIKDDTAFEGLRDFNFMYLPERTIAERYVPDLGKISTALEVQAI